ncbi:MAG: mechanosensitive ion channel domain-containing protein, partial [Candidatus Paceibacterota bacterium]
FLSIYLDKPFVVGDFIIIGEESGTVKKIGIRSTRVLSLKGEELIISNRKLMDNVIHNYKRLVKRRKTFLLKIAGNTNSKKLKEALDIIKNAIKKQDLVEYDRVNFSDIVGGGYIFEAVYFIKSNDYNKYMDIQESINFKIIEDFEKKDIKLNN